MLEIQKGLGLKYKYIECWIIIMFLPNSKYRKSLKLRGNHRIGKLGWKITKFNSSENVVPPVWWKSWCYACFLGIRGASICKKDEKWPKNRNIYINAVLSSTLSSNQKDMTLENIWYYYLIIFFYIWNLPYYYQIWYFFA